MVHITTARSTARSAHLFHSLFSGNLLAYEAPVVKLNPVYLNVSRVHTQLFACDSHGPGQD